MNKIIILMLYLGLESCSIKKNTDQSDNCLDISEIKLINHTLNKQLEDTSYIVDKDEITNFCKLLKSKVSIGTPNIRSAYGFFEYKIYASDEYLGHVDVIFTIFDGIVIRNIDGAYFKQDEFLNYSLITAGKK